MYKSARKGIAVEPKTRMVRIEVFEITKIELPHIHFRIHCGKGTYIRSIANDLGKALGVGAYLASLRRTKIGEFDVNNAWVLPELVTVLQGQKEKNKQEKNVPVSRLQTLAILEKTAFPQFIYSTAISLDNI